MATDPADRYPTFYVYKLLKNYARGGEKVVDAASDYNGLGVYAVREYELPLVLGLAALALATTGAGRFSLDHLIFRGNG